MTQECTRMSESCADRSFTKIPPKKKVRKLMKETDSDITAREYLHGTLQELNSKHFTVPFVPSLSPSSTACSMAHGDLPLPCPEWASSTWGSWVKGKRATQVVEHHGGHLRISMLSHSSNIHFLNENGTFPPSSLNKYAKMLVINLAGK